MLPAPTCTRHQSSTDNTQNTHTIPHFTPPTRNRYCLGPFDDEDDAKVAPCKCRGGQQWCHMSCLRQWQRSVLVTQPTHPAFYERDERQFTCNVCKSEFSVKPPSRAEMMAQFTGAGVHGDEHTLFDHSPIAACFSFGSSCTTTSLANAFILGRGLL